MGGIKMEQQDIKYSINGTDGNYELIATKQTRQTLFRQTKEEYEELKREAHAHNMNVSEYIRYLVAKERKEKGNG